MERSRQHVLFLQMAVARNVAGASADGGGMIVAAARIEEGAVKNGLRLLDGNVRLARDDGDANVV